MYLDDLIPEIEAHIPDVTDDIYMAGLRYGTRRFFKDSQIWCKPVPFKNISSTAVEFEVQIPDETVLLAVPIILVNGKPIKSTNFSDVRAAQQRNGIPCMWYRDGAILHVGPTPSREFDLEIMCVLVPTRDSTEIDADTILEKYSDAVVHLARYHILSMSQKPWTDLRTAGVAKGEYMEELVIARREALGYLDNRNNMMAYDNGNGQSSDY